MGMLDAVLAALADLTRRAILACLAKGNATAIERRSELVESLV